MGPRLGSELWTNWLRCGEVGTAARSSTDAPTCPPVAPRTRAQRRGGRRLRERKLSTQSTTPITTAVLIFFKDPQEKSNSAVDKSSAEAWRPHRVSPADSTAMAVRVFNPSGAASGLRPGVEAECPHSYGWRSMRRPVSAYPNRHAAPERGKASHEDPR